MSHFVRTLLAYVRKYPFSSALILLVWYLSFFTPPKTQLDDVPFIDKWTHLAMYGSIGLSIWIEYLWRHKTILWRRLLLWAYLALIAMSALIELLQEYCTGGRRSGDLADLAANALGVSLGAILGLIILRLRR